MCLVLSFSSCQKEENLMQEMKAAKLLPEVEEPSADVSRCVPPVTNFYPCDKKFRFTATANGVPDLSTYTYQIEDMLGNVVDSGTLTTGASTNPVLSYCVQYKITVYGPCFGVRYHTLYSDGCGGVWVC